MPCSAVTLSLATITGIIATVLLVIAFTSDNWIEVEVARAKIKENITNYDEQTRSYILDQLMDKYYYYPRSTGLFRICFTSKERPPKTEVYLSLLDNNCFNIEYFPQISRENASEDFETRLHMLRAVASLFIASFIVIGITFIIGIIGCWKRSQGKITATAILMLLACLMCASGMGLWHGVEYYEKEKNIGEEFYQQWSNILRDNSYQQYGWSFYLAWSGVGSCLVSMTILLIASSRLGKERAREQAQNVQYIMPVYPQKQQYAYAGYPAAAAYPGPYYHGSQSYGPYNY